jgi:hypothetical protein
MFKIIFTSSTVLLLMFISSTSVTHAATVATATTTPELKDPVAIEKSVREYFADIPVMIEIARCESKFRQYTDAGNVLRGGSSGGMIGIFQFYELIHKSAALALGFDIETVEGNIAYAKYVYTQEGTRPWVSCVPDVIPVAQVMTKADKELQIKLLTKVVELLTELLKMELAKR